MIEIILQLVCFLKYCFGIWLRWKTMIRRIFRMLNLEIFARHMQAKNDAFERESCIWMCASCCMGNNTSDRWGYSYIYIYFLYNNPLVNHSLLTTSTYKHYIIGSPTPSPTPEVPCRRFLIHVIAECGTNSAAVKRHARHAAVRNQLPVTTSCNQMTAYI